VQGQGIPGNSTTLDESREFPEIPYPGPRAGNFSDLAEKRRLARAGNSREFHNPGLSPASLSHPQIYDY